LGNQVTCGDNYTYDRIKQPNPKARVSEQVIDSRCWFSATNTILGPVIVSISFRDVMLISPTMNVKLCLVMVKIMGILQKRTYDFLDSIECMHTF